MKNIKRTFKKPINWQGKAIMLGVMILLVFLMTNFASAWFPVINKDQNLKADVIISPDANAYPAVEIKDWLGLGNPMEDLILTAHTSQCGSACSSEIEITTYSDSALIDSIRFETINAGGSRTEEPIKSYQFYVKTGEHDIEVPDYQKQCTPVNYENGSIGQSCSSVLTGSHTETVSDWTPYSPGEIMPAGTYDIKLEGSKRPDKTVDWKITSHGQEISDWSVWTAGGLVGYYKLDESSGNMQESVYSINNATSTDVQQGLSSPYAIIGKAVNFTLSTSRINLNALPMVNGNGLLSINMWVNLRNTTAIIFVGSSNCAGHLNYELDGTDLQWGACGIDGVHHTYAMNLNSWQMITAVYNKTTVVYYVNGTNIGYENYTTNFATGSTVTLGKGTGLGGANFYMDEVGIWNRSLTSAEVTSLWNSGTGLPYGITVVTTINSPADNYTTTSNSNVFNCSATSYGNALTNISLWDNSTGSWKLNLTNAVSGTANTTTFTNYYNISQMAVKWSCGACSNDGTCAFAENRTITLNKNYVINSQTYDATTGVFSPETFKINITIKPTLQISSGSLIYNNTAYGNTSISSNSNTYILTNQVVTPYVSAPINISFYWNIIQNDSSVINTTSLNQTVNPVLIDNCTAYTDLILNYTLYDQDSNTPLNATANSSIIEVLMNLYSYGTSSLITTFNNSYSNTNNAKVCMKAGILNATTYSMNYQTRFYANSYATEFKYGQNITINNNTIPQNIGLYDLLSTNSQEFLATYRDSNLIPQQGVLIDVQRQYIPLNSFISVETPITDDRGQAITHLVLGDVVYNFVVTKDGQLLAVFTNNIARCDNIATGLCTITLDQASSANNLPDFSQYLNLQYGFNYDNSTQTLQVLFKTVDGTTQSINWTVNQFENYGNVTICTGGNSLASGTFTCAIPSTYLNSSIIASLFINGAPVANYIFSTGASAASIFGGTRVILGLLMYMTLTLLFISNPIALVIGAMLGIIFASLFFMVDGGTFFGAGAVIAYFIIAGILIIIQMNRRTQQ